MNQPADPQVVSLSKMKVACSQCNLYQLCLPLGLEGSDLDQLDALINRQRLQRGSHLFEAGDDFQAIYAVRTGSVKTYTLTEDGREQITGFHLPGELLGLDAISDNTHPCYAKSLETTSFCEIPYSQLEHLSGNLPSLQHQLLRLMSHEIHNDECLVTLLGKRSAEERLASFLLSLSTRFKARGFSPSSFNLSMSRTDIGNYLGLAVETVSRMFTRFQEQGIMKVNGKLISDLDISKLQQMAQSCPPQSKPKSA